MTEAVGSTPFSEAMTLTTVSSDDTTSVFEGAIDEHWTIGPMVHGGTMLALASNAARTALGREAGQEPIAVSGNFLSAPKPGTLRVVTTIRKRGRRVSLVDVELSQGDRTAVHAVITLGEPERDEVPLLSVNPIEAMMPPDPPAGLEPIGPGHLMEDIVHMAHYCDIRPSLTKMVPPPGEPPVIEYWIRPKQGVPDLLFALLCADVSAPVTAGVNRFGWAPTVQLTAYLRAIPVDGWLRVTATTTQIGQGYFDEDSVVADYAGRIIVQARQLAITPLAQP